jgi:hypothetical protein
MKLNIQKAVKLDYTTLLEQSKYDCSGHVFCVNSDNYSNLIDAEKEGAIYPSSQPFESRDELEGYLNSAIMVQECTGIKTIDLYFILNKW